MEEKDKPAKGKKSPKPGANLATPENLAAALYEEQKKQFEKVAGLINPPLDALLAIGTVTQHQNQIVGALAEATKEQIQSLGMSVLTASQNDPIIKVLANVSLLNTKAKEQISAYNVADGIFRLAGYLKAKGLILPALPEDLERMAAWFWQLYHKFELAETKDLPVFDDLALHRFCEYLTERHELRVSLTKDEPEPVDPVALEDVVDWYLSKSPAERKSISEGAQMPGQMTVLQHAFCAFFKQEKGIEPMFTQAPEGKVKAIKSYCKPLNISPSHFQQKFNLVENGSKSGNEYPFANRTFDTDREAIRKALMNYPKALIAFEKAASEWERKNR